MVPHAPLGRTPIFGAPKHAKRQGCHSLKFAPLECPILQFALQGSAAFSRRYGPTPRMTLFCAFRRWSTKLVLGIPSLWAISAAVALLAGCSIHCLVPLPTPWLASSSGRPTEWRWRREYRCESILLKSFCVKSPPRCNAFPGL